MTTALAQNYRITPLLQCTSHMEIKESIIHFVCDVNQSRGLIDQLNLSLMLLELINIYVVVLSMLLLLSLLLLLKKNSAQHRRGDIFFVRVDKSHCAEFLTD